MKLLLGFIFSLFLIGGAMCTQAPAMGCDMTPPMKFDELPADLVDMNQTIDGYSVYKVTGETAWKLYKDGMRRPWLEAPLSDPFFESEDHLVIVDRENKFIFILELEI